MDQEHTPLDELRHRIDPVLTKVVDGGERLLGERPTMEHVLLVLFLVVGVYMYRGASEFSPAAQTFPQMMSGATIVFSLLLLARNYLQTVGPLLAAVLGAYLVYDGGMTFLDTGDGLLYLISGTVLLVAAIGFRERFGSAVESFVAEPVQVMGGNDEPSVRQAETDDESEPDESDSDSSAMYSYDIDDPRGPVFTGALCALYMLLTFSIGMLYATPIFVALWTIWVRMEKIRAVAITVLSFVIAILFYEFVEGEIATGWLTGWQLPTPTDLIAFTHGTNLLTHATETLIWGVSIV